MGERIEIQCVNLDSVNTNNVNANNVDPRRMAYPYTLTSKVVHFPYKVYWTYSWLFKYWGFGILLSVPLFYKIGKLSQSPENVKKWKEIREKQFSGPHH